MGGDFGEPGAGGGQFCGGGWADEGFDDEAPGFFEIGDGGCGCGSGGGVSARVPAIGEVAAEPAWCGFDAVEGGDGGTCGDVVAGGVEDFEFG